MTKDFDKKLQLLIDKQEIEELVSNWTFFRDRKDWENLKNCFADDSTIVTLFYSGPIDGFIESIKKLTDSKHLVCNMDIHVSNDRAVAESNTVFSGRVNIKSMEMDLTVFCRVYDFLEKNKNNRWVIKKRVVNYEKDRLDPLGWRSILWYLYYPAKKLQTYPDGCKHFCYFIEQKIKIPEEKLSSVITKDSLAEIKLREETQLWLSE